MAAGGPESVVRWDAVHREGEALFRDMVDGLPLMVWMHGPDGEQELVNATFCEYFGVTREQVKEGGWQELVHPEDRSPYVEQYETSVREARPFRAEVRVLRADGQWRWVESLGRPRFDDAGEYRGFVGVCADVTERKEALDALRQSEERFRLAIEGSPVSVFETDRDLRYIWIANPNLGFAPDEIVGKRDEELGNGPGGQPLPEQGVAEFVELKRRVLETGRPERRQMSGRVGSRRYTFDISAEPVRDAAGRIVGVRGAAMDVTALREAAERLREEARRKDEFLAMLGHELRNPLAAIRSAADLVGLVTTDDPVLERAHGVFERQSAHMARLIDGLLEVSRIARGKIVLDRRILDIRGVIETVVEDRKHDLGRRHLRLHVEIPPTPLWVRADPVRLAQVLDNLVCNAIKFTDPPGSVTVSVTQAGDRAILSVRDTGVGIEPEVLDRLFEPFQQATQDVARAAGGLGLGLALAKGLTELHEGTIVAHSAGRGTGAEFVIELPLSAAPDEEAPSRVGDAPVGRRILVVEDNDDAAQMLQDLLQLRGHEVAVVGTGAEALDYLHREAADVVLCDIGLPGMDGYELAREIRADPNLRDLLLVAVTGYGQPRDRLRSREAGFDQHLTKPVDTSALESALANPQSVSS